jgi:nitrogen fixation protein NifQ
MPDDPTPGSRPDLSQSGPQACPEGTPGGDIARAGATRIEQLMDGALDAHSPDTLLFAKLIAAREVRGELALLGLSNEALQALFRRLFVPGLAQCAAVPHAVNVITQEHAEFAGAMRTLILMYASATVHADDANCLASIIAHACLRPDHLWRDLGLQGRDDVTAMLKRYFPELESLNVANLRWKKFLAQQLALSSGQEPGPAPGCPGCEDYGYCFPPAP